MAWIRSQMERLAGRKPTEPTTADPASDVDLGEMEFLRQAVLKLHEKMYRQKKHEGKVISQLMLHCDKVLATILGMFTSIAFYNLVLHLAVDGLSFSQNATTEITCRVIYVFLVITVGAVGQLKLKVLKEADPRDALYSHSHLIDLCLPMLHGWAWKDLVATVVFHASGEGTQVQTLCFIALIFIGMVAGLETLPMYRNALKLQGTDEDTICAVLTRTPGKIYLAVGFCWNELISYPKDQLVELDVVEENAFFKLAVQVFWCILVTGIISKINTLWHLKWKKGIQDAVQRDADLAESGELDDLEGFRVSSTLLTETFSLQLMDVFLNALSFVYAWQILDTCVTAYFEYIMLTTKDDADYQTKLAFAVGITVIMVQLSIILQTKIKWKGEDKVQTQLFTNALSLNVGWAWMMFCLSAINSVSSDGHADWLAGVACFGFVIPTSVILHLQLHEVKRQWDEQASAEIQQDFAFQYLRRHRSTSALNSQVSNTQLGGMVPEESVNDSKEPPPSRRVAPLVQEAPAIEARHEDLGPPQGSATPVDTSI